MLTPSQGRNRETYSSRAAERPPHKVQSEADCLPCPGLLGSVLSLLALCCGVGVRSPPDLRQHKNWPFKCSGTCKHSLSHEILRKNCPFTALFGPGPSFYLFFSRVASSLLILQLEVFFSIVPLDTASHATLLVLARISS